MEDSNHSSEEAHRLIGRLNEELSLRRYSPQTRKSYVFLVKKFLASGKTLTSVRGLSALKQPKGTRNGSCLSTESDFFQNNV